MSRQWAYGAVRRAVPALGLLALPFHGGDLAAQSARERYTLGSGQVAIYNLAGELTVEPSNGADVVVEVVRGGPDASQLRVETGPIRGMQTLRVLYPGDHVVYPEIGRGSHSNVQIGEDGTFGDKEGIVGRHEMTVSGSGSGVEAWANVHVSVPRGQTLRLQWVAGETHIGAIEGDVRVRNSSSTVEVRGLHGKLAVDTGSGEVLLKDTQGDLVIDTGSGGVTIEGARGSSIMLDTGSGEIRGTAISADKLVGDTGSGAIQLDQVRASTVMLDTGSGHVDLDLSSDIDKLEVDTGSGGVTMTVPPKLGAEFDIETGSGGIDVDVPHETISVQRDRVRGRIGDGQGRIHVDTGSGGVRLQRRTSTSERTGAVLGFQVVPPIG